MNIGCSLVDCYLFEQYGLLDIIMYKLCLWIEGYVCIYFILLVMGMNLSWSVYVQGRILIFNYVYQVFCCGVEVRLKIVCSEVVGINVFLVLLLRSYKILFSVNQNFGSRCSLKYGVGMSVGQCKWLVVVVKVVGGWFLMMFWNCLNVFVNEEGE